MSSADHEGFRREAIEGLVAVCLTDSSFLRDALTDFTDTDLFTQIRPLLDGSDDAELGRRIREQARRCVLNVLDEAEIDALARRMALRAAR